jgi:hypothetical protein
MERLGLIKNCFNDVKGEINELIKENGNEMYEGVFDVINELENDDEYWIELINDLEEEEEEDFIEGTLMDCVDRELMERFGEQFKNNLIKLGYKFDYNDYVWDLTDKDSKRNLTCYGVIWDYWYDLDTCVRESVGDIFESKLEE